MVLVSTDLQVRRIRHELHVDVLAAETWQKCYFFFVVVVVAVVAVVVVVFPPRRRAMKSTKEDKDWRAYGQFRRTRKGGNNTSRTKRPDKRSGGIPNNDLKCFFSKSRQEQDQGPSIKINYQVPIFKFYADGTQL